MASKQIAPKLPLKLLYVLLYTVIELPHCRDGLKAAAD